MKKLSILLVVFMLLTAGLFAQTWDAGWTRLDASASAKLTIDLDGQDEEGNDAVGFGLSTSSSYRFELGVADASKSHKPVRGVHGMLSLTTIGSSWGRQDGDVNAGNAIKAPGIEAWIKMKPFHIVLKTTNWWDGTMPWQREYARNLTMMRTDHAFLTSGSRELFHGDYGEGPWWGWGWSDSKIRNRVGVQYANAGVVAFGYDSATLKWNLKLATESAAGGANGDGIALGADVKLTMIPNLLVFASAVMGLKYGDNSVENNGSNPIGIGAKLVYDLPLTDDLTLKPDFSVDVELEDDADGSVNIEMVPGFVLLFPGYNGPWGNDAPMLGLRGGTEQGYTGLAVRLGYSQVASEDEPRIHLMTNLSNTGQADKGLIPKLSLGAQLEMIDITATEASGYYKSVKAAFGFDYEIRDVTMGDLTGMIVPHAHVDLRDNLAAEVGSPTIGIGLALRISMIPNCTIDINWGNSMDADTAEADKTKGQIGITATVGI